MKLIIQELDQESNAAVHSLGYVEADAKSELIAQAFQFVESIHQTDYSGHDFEHIKRVWQNAQQLLASEPSAQRQVVELAVLLHDVDDYKLSDETGRAKKWLDGQGVNPELIEQVLDIIDTIGFSKTGYNPQLRDIETKIVYDADKLDAIGAIGIARTFAFGGAKSRPLFEPERLPTDELDLEAYAMNAKSGKNHTVNHFFEKLIKLADLMQTKRGQELALKRKLTMLSFLEDFFAEQCLQNWLALLKQTQN
ncbi:MAG: HD domain-containing protein [Burkholderiales bacterium]|nr:HD domain-containing protein [Burkholderiales bacterium]